MNIAKRCLLLIFLVSCHTQEIIFQNDKDEVRVDIVFTACEKLYKEFYDPDRLNFPKLFNASLKQVKKTLAEKNRKFEPKKIPDDSPYSLARITFTAELESARDMVGEKIADKNEIVFAALEGLLEAVDDSHTYLLLPEENQRRKASSANKAEYGGGGFILRKLTDDCYFVDAAFEEGPAYRAGIRRLDALVEIDGQAIPKKFEEMVKMVRGPPGTIVKVGVKRKQEKLTFAITRAGISKPSAEDKIIESGGVKYGYIRLYDFKYEKTFVGLLTLRDKIRESGARGIIVDVRGNPGGDIQALNASLEFFLKAGTSTYNEFGRRGYRKHYTVIGQYTNLPVVVLIDERSGSASELFAAVLQENGRGVVVGKKTGGDVNAGIKFELPYGAAMEITVAELRTAKGKLLEKNGVVPDVEVELSKDDIENGIDPQLEKAIEILKEKTKAQK